MASPKLSFFDLPGELRNQIYDSIISDRDTFKNHPIMHIRKANPLFRNPSLSHQAMITLSLVFKSFAQDCHSVLARTPIHRLTMESEFDTSLHKIAAWEGAGAGEEGKRIESLFINKTKAVWIRDDDVIDLEKMFGIWVICC